MPVQIKSTHGNNTNADRTSAWRLQPNKRSIVRSVNPHTRAVVALEKNRANKYLWIVNNSLTKEYHQGEETKLYRAMAAANIYLFGKHDVHKEHSLTVFDDKRKRVEIVE